VFRAVVPLAPVLHAARRVSWLPSLHSLAWEREFRDAQMARDDGRWALIVVCLVSGARIRVDPGRRQEPACSFYKVNTRMLNVSKDAAGEALSIVLVFGRIACVTRQQKVEGRDRGYVAYSWRAPIDARR